MTKATLAAFVGLIALSVAFPARAEWPAKVFAPYMYIGSGDDFKLTDCDDACGLKHYTLAFIIARQEGSGKDVKYLPEPSWDGRMTMDKDVYKDQIDAIRVRGGDVIMSFGGEAGREIAIVIEDPEELEKAYQSIIDRYKFTWLDFDIEGSNLDKNMQASQRRNDVLAKLQAKNPGLRISFTLPVDPNGISKASQALLVDAHAKGVKTYSANIMVMFFGQRFINKGKTEGELGIESANAAYAQIQKIDPDIKIGLCPCITGMGNGEVFTVEDAKTLLAFAQNTPWVASMHYWSINDDAARPRRRRAATQQAASTQPAAPARTPWAFANILKAFTQP